MGEVGLDNAIGHKKIFFIVDVAVGFIEIVAKPKFVDEVEDGWVDTLDELSFVWL